MNSNEMVIVATIAANYESRHRVDEDRAIEVATMDFLKFKKFAPKTWKCLWNKSSWDDRRIGNHIYALIASWKDSGMSFKNYCADLEDKI
jgi:hypothetical protein